MCICAYICHNYGHAVNAERFDYDLGELLAALEILSVPDGYEQRHQLLRSSRPLAELKLNGRMGYQKIMYTLTDLMQQLPQLVADTHVNTEGGTDVIVAAATMAAAGLLHQLSLSLQH
jgi:hypothetical protein